MPNSSGFCTIKKQIIAEYTSNVTKCISTCANTVLVSLFCNFGQVRVVKNKAATITNCGNDKNKMPLSNTYGEKPLIVPAVLVVRVKKIQAATSNAHRDNSKTA